MARSQCLLMLIHWFIISVVNCSSQYCPFYHGFLKNEYLVLERERERLKKTVS